MVGESPASEPLELGRYALFARIASGGMATVYLGRQRGAAGFGRTVAIKRLHPHIAKEPDFVSMFLDEARLAARVMHPNVVPTLDVVASDSEIFLVMDYVKGESLANLLKLSQQAGATVPVPVGVAIVIDLLNGLHAAHEARDERDQPLHIVHRDVSPQNLLVGADGVARVLDFGVAKAAMRLQTTREGQLKGKLPYMAPEQISGVATRASDIYAMGVVLWETLACKRLFKGKTEPELLQMVMSYEVPPPSTMNPLLPAELDGVTLRALAKNPEDRFPTARAMAEALDLVVRPASANQVAGWVEKLAGPALAQRARLVAEVESQAEGASNSEVRRLMSFHLLPNSDSSASLPRVTFSPPGSENLGKGDAATVLATPASKRHAGVDPAQPRASRLPQLLAVGVAAAAGAALLGALAISGGRGGERSPGGAPSPVTTTSPPQGAATASTAGDASASVESGSVATAVPETSAAPPQRERDERPAGTRQPQRRVAGAAGGRGTAEAGAPATSFDDILRSRTMLDQR